MKNVSFEYSGILMENLEMNEKSQKIKGRTYKITNTSFAKCPRLANLDLN